MKLETFLVGIILMILGFVFGLAQGHTYLTKYQLKTVGTSIEEYVCSDKGCSFLIEHPNSTRTWIWAPKLVVKEKVRE